MIKAILGLHFSLKTPINAQEKIWVGRCCLKNSKMAVNDLIYFKPPCCMIPPIKFQLKEYVGWKKLFEKFQEGCLVHGHLMYLSRRKEAFLSLIFT